MSPKAGPTINVSITPTVGQKQTIDRPSAVAGYLEAFGSPSITGRNPGNIGGKMGAVIGFVLSQFGFEFFVIGLLAAGVAIVRHPPPRDRFVIGERLLAYYALFPIGCLYLVNFVYHVFFGAMSARFIGWADSPFQTELGFASLGFAVVGFLAWRGGYELRLAAVVGPAMFLLGAAGGHIYQMIAHDNYAAGNAGLLLWMDVVIPAAGLLFLVMARPVHRRRQNSDLGAAMSSGGRNDLSQQLSGPVPRQRQ